MDAEQRRDMTEHGMKLNDGVLKPGVKQALAAGEPLPRHISEAQEIVRRVMEMEKDSEMYKQTCEEAAVAFLDACSLEPTHDAILQLTEAFLPALAIMCQRGYDPEGANWRAMGWRGLLWELHKRWKRIWFNGWKSGRWDPNNSIDFINYCGYYYRLQHGGEPWGEIGEPGNESRH